MGEGVSSNYSAYCSKTRQIYKKTATKNTGIIESLDLSNMAFSLKKNIFRCVDVAPRDMA